MKLQKTFLLAAALVILAGCGKLEYASREETPAPGPVPAAPAPPPPAPLLSPQTAKPVEATKPPAEDLDKKQLETVWLLTKTEFAHKKEDYPPGKQHITFSGDDFLFETKFGKYRGTYRLGADRNQVIPLALYHGDGPIRGKFWPVIYVITKEPGRGEVLKMSFPPDFLKVADWQRPKDFSETYAVLTFVRSPR